MEGKSFGEYRSFSKAAQEVGMTDRDERKLSGMDPGLLLDDVSQEVRERVAPEMLVTFLKTLQGEKNADPKHVLEIGNALYRYRDDQSRSVAELDEKEDRLVGLACRLVENAFYDGRLDDLNEAQAASVAFVTNVTAKLLEQGKNRSQNWYDAEKFRLFFRDVESFKNAQLSEMFAFKEPGMTIRQGIGKYEEMIGSELEKLKGIVDGGDWSPAFSDLQKKIDTALVTLRDSDILRRHAYELDRFQTAFDRQMARPEMIADYARKEVRALEEKLRNEDVSYRTYGNFSDFLYQATRPEDTVFRPGGYYEEARSVANLYKRRKEITGTNVPSQKSKTLKDFSALRQSIAEKNVPEAFETLGAIFGPVNEVELGKIGGFIQGTDTIGRLLRKRNALRSCERAFDVAAESLVRSTARLSGIPYFIKSYLIAVSLLKGWDENPRMGFDRLTKIDVYSPPGTENGTGVATHDFLEGAVSAKREDHRSERIPAYHVLHYKTKEIPYAVWSVRYLQSKKRGNVPQETSSV